MSKIVINDEYETIGDVSISRTLNTNEKPNRLIIEGVLKTHFYFEEILSIETDRYYIDGITVLQENFGSNDINIVYGFIAGNLQIKGGSTIYTAEEIVKLLDEEQEQKEVDIIWKKIIKKIKQKLMTLK